MLETLCILIYRSVKMIKWRQSAGKIAKAKSSETSTPNILIDDDTVRPSWRHEEVSRNDLSFDENQSNMYTKCIRTQCGRSAVA